MMKEKSQYKTPRVQPRAVFGVGKFEGDGPYVPNAKDLIEAVENAKKVEASANDEELKKQITRKK